jgi:small subunit ribosomal protein S2
MTANTVIDAMFNVGAHFGYSRARRHASVSPFLFGAKNGVDIIDLTHTAKQLDIARARAEEVAKSGKPVLFVGTKQEIRALVEETALSLNMPYVTERWVGGMLTNWPEIRKRTNRRESSTSTPRRRSFFLSVKWVAFRRNLVASLLLKEHQDSL